MIPPPPPPPPPSLRVKTDFKKSGLIGVQYTFTDKANIFKRKLFNREQVSKSVLIFWTSSDDAIKAFWKICRRTFGHSLFIAADSCCNSLIIFMDSKRERMYAWAILFKNKKNYFLSFIFLKIHQDLITVYLQKMSNEAKRAFSNVIAQNGKNLWYLSMPI